MSDTHIELLVHPMCPYAQRALYTSSFKRIPVEIHHVSLANPSSWFLEVNPMGETPSCRVTHKGFVYNLTESLNISEFLESFPGHSLYPRTQDGERDPIAKCIIDVFIKIKIGRFASTLYSIYWKNEYNDDEKRELVEAFLDMNSCVEEGNFVMHKKLHKNEITFADVMLLPYVERMSAFKEVLPGFLKELNLDSLWRWFDNMMSFDWTREHRVPASRLLNMLRIIKSGKYNGLDLPVSQYD